MKWQRRKYQQVALVAIRETRVLGLFWARQCRKSTTLGDIAFDEMTREPGRRVIAASASLLLGTELVTKATTAAEQAVIVAREATALRTAIEERAGSVCSREPARGRTTKGAAPRAGSRLQLTVADSETGRVYDGITPDEFADLYRSGRLEMRLYHDQTTYSRLQVIAPNPATARGWTGTVLRDEVGFVKAERELQEATRPIIDTDPSFKMIYASNLPLDDRHPWFEMTMPADPSLEFPPNPNGHFYRSQTGLRVHRVSIADAYAAGHTLYNDNGEAMTLEEAAANSRDKGAWRRNYSLVHEYGGAAAIDLLSLHTAQQRGVGQCACVLVDNDLDFQRALAFLREKLGRAEARPSEVGVGFDVATTAGGLSNPSSVAVIERRGVELFHRLNVVWKERDPKVARDRLRQIVAVARPRRLVIDASNERYFAEETKTEFRALVPVELHLAGAKVEPLPAGYDAPINWKTYAGDLYAATINDNRMACPPESYFKESHRAVIKEKGSYTCEVNPTNGDHGDTFDAGKLALLALDTNRAAADYEVCATRRDRNAVGERSVLV